MSAFAQFTEEDHDGAVGEEETEDHVGSPERDMLVTCQPRATAALQMPKGRKVSYQKAHVKWGLWRDHGWIVSSEIASFPLQHSSIQRQLKH